MDISPEWTGALEALEADLRRRSLAARTTRAYGIDAGQFARWASARELEPATASTREVRRRGDLIELTPKEYTVLEYLMRHAGRVMSRTLITEYAWGYHFDPGTNIVDVVINHLRKKIDAKHGRKLITTVRGVGYMIKDG